MNNKKEKYLFGTTIGNITGMRYRFLFRELEDGNLLYLAVRVSGVWQERQGFYSKEDLKNISFRGVVDKDELFIEML